MWQDNIKEKIKPQQKFFFFPFNAFFSNKANTKVLFQDLTEKNLKIKFKKIDFFFVFVI
jgi:hypothetical protein